MNGQNKNSDGVTFSASISPQLSGRWALSNIVIKSSNRGVYKPTGDIGNSFTNVNFTSNNYGYYAVGQASPTMHAGADTFRSCEFTFNSLAAIYINCGNVAAGGTSIRDCILEENPGFGIFVDGYPTSYTPLVMDNVWFERNATSVTVTINDINYTPRDVYLKNTTSAYLINSTVGDIELVSSSLIIQNCFVSYDTTHLTLDPTSVCVMQNVHLNGGLIPVEVQSVVKVSNQLGNFSPRMLAPKRTNKIHSPNNVLQSITFADSNTYSFSGTMTVWATTSANGQIFDSCANLIIPPNQTLLQAGVTITLGKWYMFTIDLEHISGDLSDLQVNFSGNFTLANNFATLLVTGKWRTIAGMGVAGADGFTQLSLINGSLGPQSINLSALQIMEFDTQLEMLNYYNSGSYTMPITAPRVTYSTTPPTAGDWAKGDRVINRVPAAGQAQGWVCTTSGAPGTWVSMGVLPTE